MGRVLLLPLCAVAIALGSCSSFVADSSTRIQINSEPAGALARTSRGQTCTTPCNFAAGAKDEFTVTITKEGFVDQTVDVRSRVAPGGESWLGGWMGGPDMELYPNPVFVRLAPVPPPPPVARRRKK
jgi:hypothetical protein